MVLTVVMMSTAETLLMVSSSVLSNVFLMLSRNDSCSLACLWRPRSVDRIGGALAMSSLENGMQKVKNLFAFRSLSWYR